jgi:membrane fusion protein (multidrug efflux system)
MSAAEEDMRRTWQQRFRTPLMVGGPAVVLIAGIYLYYVNARYESTDDAYVQTARVAISANVDGRVKDIAVRDNQIVQKGDVLFHLDEVPFQIAVEEATAQLASARIQIDTLKANYRQHLAEAKAAQETLAFQQHEFDRQQRLLASGISSQLQLDRARHALDDARAQLASSQQQIGAVVASLGGNPDVAPERHPLVQRAQAALDRAKLNLSYTVIYAPGDGIVTRVDNLQAGTYIAATAPVFALVKSNDVWIEANFKENQLQRMRVGQPVSVEIDSYPGKKFEGKVASLSPGTGSQFSMLPAENATGNWVKVVQRLPIRVELSKLDPECPLHTGLSANVRVDIRDQGQSQPDKSAIAVAAK